MNQADALNAAIFALRRIKSTSDQFQDSDEDDMSLALEEVGDLATATLEEIAPPTKGS